MTYTTTWPLIYSSSNDRSYLFHRSKDRALCRFTCRHVPGGVLSFLMTPSQQFIREKEHVQDSSKRFVSCRILYKSPGTATQHGLNKDILPTDEGEILFSLQHPHRWGQRSENNRLRAALPSGCLSSLLGANCAHEESHSWAEVCHEAPATILQYVVFKATCRSLF